MLCKHEPTKSEKAKGAALAVAGLAAEKAVEAKVKADKDIVPTLAEKAAEARDLIVEKAADVRDAAAQHVETAAEKIADATAEQRETLADKADAAKAATVATFASVADTAADARKDAAKKGDKLAKKADKKSSKAQKKADKKAAALAAFVAAKAETAQKTVEKHATETFGADARQDVAYKAAALKGRAGAVAEDKGLTTDSIRDFYTDEMLPHVKELIAAATAAGASAVSQLPEGAQKQVVQYAPALAPKKKKGGVLLTLGALALAGAGYLVYADQQKKRAADAQLSEASIADSTATRGDEMTINNPVTNFAQADDTTMVHPAGADAPSAEPANGPGTAATWTDAEQTGHMTTAGLEDPNAGETRSSRRAAREDH